MSAGNIRISRESGDAVFIAQEKVPTESVTEVLYVTQIIDDYKQKELAYQQELVKALKEARIANDAGQNFFGKCPMISGLRSMASWVCWILKRKLGCSRKIERMP